MVPVTGVPALQAGVPAFGAEVLGWLLVLGVRLLVRSPSGHHSRVLLALLLRSLRRFKGVFRYRLMTDGRRGGFVV